MITCAVNRNLVGFGGVGFLSTDQKKKLLWGNKKNNPTEEVIMSFWMQRKLFLQVFDITLFHFAQTTTVLQSLGLASVSRPGAPGKVQQTHGNV